MVARSDYIRVVTLPFIFLFFLGGKGGGCGELGGRGLRCGF